MFGRRQATLVNSPRKPWAGFSSAMFASIHSAVAHMHTSRAHLWLSTWLLICLIGLAGLAFHPVFLAYTGLSQDTVYPALSSPASIRAWQWGSAALLIAPQSILLGMTFPLMSGGYLRVAPRADPKRAHQPLPGTPGHASPAIAPAPRWSRPKASTMRPAARPGCRQHRRSQPIVPPARADAAPRLARLARGGPALLAPSWAQARSGPPRCHPHHARWRAAPQHRPRRPAGPPSMPASRPRPGGAARLSARAAWPAWGRTQNSCAPGPVR